MGHTLSLGDAASYRIQVQGHLGQQWADYLAGLSISVSANPNRTVSTLSGEVADQAALMGVLNGLYGLGFPLLAVEVEQNYTIVEMERTHE